MKGRNMAIRIPCRCKETEDIWYQGNLPGKGK